MKKLKIFIAFVVLMVAINITSQTINAEENLDDKLTLDEISSLLDEYVETQTIEADEIDILETMIENKEVNRQELKTELNTLSKSSYSELKREGYTDEQIKGIHSYDGTSDPIKYAGKISNGSKVSITYGLAGSDNTKQKVRLAYEIKWNKRPIYADVDSFGIGWIACDKNSHELSTTIVSANGEGTLYNDAGKTSRGTCPITINADNAGVVTGTFQLAGKNDTYAKRVGGVIIIKTQSGSKNLETIQVFVGYSHKIIVASLSTGFTIGYKKTNAGISFTPVSGTKILVHGHYNFKYNSQKRKTDTEK